MARRDTGKIYSATYSNVPVYEFGIEGNHVMRRRSDDWINATHILKVAEYDKPTRTRILEREVQKGVHEKVQGGYGKYQGTWIPLPDGKELAIKNNVYDKLQPMFEFVPGDKSPPPAPKHATAASTKPRAPRAPAQPKRQPAPPAGQDYDAMDIQVRGPGTPDNVTIISESAYDDYDAQYTNNSRKRRRTEDPMSQSDREFRLWADELLDYFMLQENPIDSLPTAPDPPHHANLNRAIDDKGHTALHWAAAMGDVEVMKDLIRRGASIDALARNGETPLMRAVIFTNSFDRQNMDRIAGLLIRTVNMQEFSGSTVFHHVANTTQRKSKYQCARYYMDCLLNKMAERLSPMEVESVLNSQDQQGDTAITIAARHGARKCVRSLLGRNAAVNISNFAGQTADQFIVQLNSRRQERVNDRQKSSSPFQAGHQRSTLGGAVQSSTSNGIPFDPLVPHSSLNGTSSRTKGGKADVYQSDGAIALTAQLIPALVDKAKMLASSLDDEIAEKDLELLEAERVAEMRRQERDALRKQQEELRATEMEQTSGGVFSDEQLQRELEDLQEECKILTEEEESLTLRRLMDEEQAKLGHLPQTTQSDLDEEATVREKLRIARELIAVHRERAELVQQIVQNLSMAGYAGDQELYRQLISGALGVKQDDVEGVLPEIAAELEEWRGLESVGT